MTHADRPGMVNEGLWLAAEPAGVLGIQVDLLVPAAQAELHGHGGRTTL